MDESDIARFTAFLGETCAFQWATNTGKHHPRHVSWDLVHNWAAIKQQTLSVPAGSGGGSDDGHLYAPIRDAYEIRILEVKPGTGTEDLLGCLHHCSIEFYADTGSGGTESGQYIRTQHALAVDDLTRPVWYTALSYTWGPAVFDKTITCSGRGKRITASLHAALCTFRQPDRAIFLWVDQICINQDDDEEKAGQIRLMRRIYERALNTVIWLGEASATSARGLGLLHDLASRLQFDTPCSGPADFRALGMPPADSLSWVGLWDVLTRPWFKRVWVIQEISASRDAWVFCGSDYISWERVDFTCNHFRGQGINGWLRRQFAGDNPDDNDDDDDDTDVFGTTVELSHIRLIYQTRNEGHSLFDVLVQSRASLCSDARDKVYGVLSLCSEDEAASVPVSYKPDYPAEALYCHVMAKALEKRAFRLPKVLACVDHEPSVAGLPSWVADWRRPRQTVSLGYDTAYSAMFSAAGASYPSFSVNGTVLETQGIICDTLDSFTDLFTQPELAYRDPATANSVLKACAALVSTRKTYPAAGGGVFDALWRSLVANKNHTGKEIAPASFAEIFSLLLDASTGCCPTICDQTYSERQRRPKNRGRLDVASLATRTPGKTFAEARTAMKLAVKNRRLGITQNGYIGLLQGGLQRGDAVCILRGCHVPFLVRPEAAGDAYRLIGECYVHGIMEGEAVKDVEWKTVKLV